MQRMAEMAAHGLGFLARAALTAAGTGLVLMTIFIGWQVFGRYVLNDSPAWTEPMAILLMSWFIFLGAALGVREGYHLGFEVLLYVLPNGSRNILNTISDLLVAGFGMAMSIYGVQMAAKTWNTTLPSLGVSGATSFLALIVGGVLITLFTLERLAKRFAGLEPVEGGHGMPVEG